ncbi:cation-translocating P-type ATPase [Syntrophorhabdus aromaticivorans]|uniref:cation-translocating P-type ATPase n=1 Tax=Syntrophorhabdus aromaticivorans TaxID=328301 RepID=UPI000422A7B4|nr:cation-translocating P-type ATPase [Syntrophorhabdus aromaticivorans]
MWHQKSVDDVIGELNSSPAGLSSEETQARIDRYGPNTLQEKRRKSPLMMLLDQFTDFMILVLIGAAIIAGIVGDLSDAIVIVVIVILNAVIGFIQEYRAEKAMAALKKMAAANATVIRDGINVSLPASMLVPGDIVILEAGNVVPADMRLIEVAQLRMDEAALTGESIAVEKHVYALPGEHLSLGDRRNLVFKGTFATYGRGRGIVTATGMETELGRIATMLQEEEEVKTPLQKRLAAFGRKLAFAVLAICLVVFAIGVIRGEPVLLMLLTAISLAVAAIPEALPAVVTVSLALGAKKLVQQKALIRKLPAVETLGSVTYICSDKTGTLTMNRMTVEKVYNGDTTFDRPKPDEEDGEHLLAMAMALNTDAESREDGSVFGDPTEVALLDMARKYGYEKNKLEALYPRKAEIPFDSDRKCMTTFHTVPDGSRLSRMLGSKGYISITKGAAEVIIDKSIAMAAADGPRAIASDDYRFAQKEMAETGLRILGVAIRTWEAIPAGPSPAEVEANLVMLGLVGMMDPPREEAREAVSMCTQAGINPVMITGDHPITAQVIATRLGIIDDDGQVLTGRELDMLSLAEFEEKVNKIRVYARVAPEQKLQIVKALQDKGQFVAMTGDGVNDAPALKRADIGVAMGITGTDVSKEAAAMILLDDNFATIVKAIREGRKIYDNIRKFIKYLLTTNSGEIWTLFLAPLIGLPIPLLPIHILWINLVTDGLPALALSVEHGEEDVMKRPPRHPKESVFAHGLGAHAIWVGLLMAAITLSVLIWETQRGNENWQTMVFTTLCLTQLAHVLAIRSEKESLFRIGLFSNKYLLGAVVLTFALQMATIYVPSLNGIFKTHALTMGELAITIGLSSLVFFAVEIEKLIRRRKSSLA